MIVFRREELPREIAEVNVVPLADVSLVLLIILLVLSPMMTQSMLRVQAAGKPAAEAAPRPAEVPPEGEAPERSPELVLVVSLTPRGITTGGRSFVGAGEFMAYMTEELSRREDKKVFLSPHPDTPHGRVVHMLEMLKKCGASAAALVQTQEDPPPAGGG